MNWLFSDQRLQLKYKHLVVRPKQVALPDSDIAGLVLNIPRSRLGHTQDWLNTVMLWFSNCETDDLRK